MHASAIIVTKNRRTSLQTTLAALRQQQWPADFSAELLVVDNGSSDGSAEAVPRALPPFASVHCIHHPHAGQAAGRNAALRHSQGTVIAFLDDDVHPPRSWLSDLCAPILSGHTDAVAGQVSLAPQLQRPWMTPLHRAWLAETAWLDAPGIVGMVGANMAFHRDALSKTPGFCEALGPGALGYGDDQLFAWQLAAAGFRITRATTPAVVHYPNPNRLLRKAWLAAAEARGRSQAWIGLHWFGWKARCAPLKLHFARMRLNRWRARFPMPCDVEGAPESELQLVQSVACLEWLSQPHSSPCTRSA